jgi:hypothetical protein
LNKKKEPLILTPSYATGQAYGSMGGSGIPLLFQKKNRLIMIYDTAYFSIEIC